MNISGIGFGGFTPENMMSGNMLKGGIIPEEFANASGLDKINSGLSKNFNPENSSIPLPPQNPSMGISTGIGNNLVLKGFNSTKGSFSDTLKEVVSDVNKLQIDASEKSEAFVRGEDVELHDVMIAANKARTSFQLLLELRNRGLDLYREVSRMQ